MAEPDLSKIVNLIMENPQLVEQIKNLSAAEEKKPDEDSAAEPPPSEESIKTQAYAEESTARSRRKDLLCAMKPYVSEERGKAIDSMISIADVLDMMRK